ncbi:MAG: PIN domain-containing protein [Cyanobacteria bacterium P01_C01_bin.118]
MTQVILLDAGPIGLITNPKVSPQGIACNQWLQAQAKADRRIIIPEIADYEVRRELLRAKKTKGLARLDGLTQLLEYLPLTTETMRQAAQLWAQARQQGQPTAGDNTIDGDMILVAQAMSVGISNVVIATTNIGHLSRFIAADLWQNLS